MVTVAFNATPAFYANVVTTVICIVLLVLVARIPFKRRYHWTFLLFVTCLGLFTFDGVLEQASLTAQEYWSLIPWQSPTQWQTQFGLLFLFLIQFKPSRRIARWQWAVLGCTAAYAAFWIVGDFADLAIMWKPYARVTATGYQGKPGPMQLYTNPLGVNWLVAALLVFIFYLIMSQYRSSNSPLVRTQLKYLALGVALLGVANIGAGLNNLLIVIPVAGIRQFFQAFAAGTLLVGLTRHGFYRVTPVQESATRESGLEEKIPEWVPSLEEGQTYLFNDPKLSFQSFSSLVKSGDRDGLIITRTFPEVIRAKYGLKTTPIRWLAEERREDAIAPGDLLGLSLSVKDFYRNAKKPLVLLHGIEYLTTVNGSFAPLLKLIQGVNEANAESRGVFLLSLIPGTLEKREENLLIAETNLVSLPQQ